MNRLITLSTAALLLAGCAVGAPGSGDKTASSASASPASTASAATPSAAGLGNMNKAQLVARLIEVQRPAVETIARGLVEQSMASIAQSGGQYLQTSVPAEKRDALTKAADAQLAKYRDEALPFVQSKAIEVAPSTIGPLLTQNFNEDELRQLIAWLSSPLSRKYAELNPQLGNALTTRLVSEVRPTLEPKLRELESNVANALGVPERGAATPAKPRTSKKK